MPKGYEVRHIIYEAVVEREVFSSTCDLPCIRPNVFVSFQRNDT